MAPSLFPSSLAMSRILRSSRKRITITRPAPFESAKVRQRAAKHLRREILRFLTILHAARDEGVNGREVPLVELAEASRITLRRLDQQPLVHSSEN